MFSSLSLWNRRHTNIQTLLSCIKGKSVHFFRFWGNILSFNNKPDWKLGCAPTCFFCDKKEGTGGIFHWCPCLCLVLHNCIEISLFLYEYTFAAAFSLEKKPKSGSEIRNIKTYFSYYFLRFYLSFSCLNPQLWNLFKILDVLRTQ